MGSDADASGRDDHDAASVHASIVHHRRRLYASGDDHGSGDHHHTVQDNEEQIGELNAFFIPPFSLPLIFLEAGDISPHFRVKREKPMKPDENYWLRRIEKEFFEIQASTSA